ncbi:DUF2934 domain-containing protein [Ciceribacter sp. L1K23]|uniref:DUF2934 domain-containing protein n=1 Tax=Ciceribacter sp. L1K23 TaxID=2820276 RepID=UPI001B83BA12|nr:DUF2934 domain-containing protein [Ciceribacter sp. L1K23]MBR0555743.1 DUF2934 domain-containing protein [Ciceribacter sp. L1K23]
MTDREQQIRERAYALWQEQGEAEGLHESHWHQAEQEIDREYGEGTISGDTPPGLSPEAPQAGMENAPVAAPAKSKAKAKSSKPAVPTDGVHMGAIPGDPVVR